MQEYILNAFDLVNVSFRTEAGKERVQNAHAYAQSLYEELKVHGGSLTRDRLLAILLLGITDDLLQHKDNRTSYDDTLLSLLKKIDEAVPLSDLPNKLGEQD